mmetsp:Transcript_22792/g.44796  ORF Transcript_22792/g.44796 Transcript_22792/m.44796 type:complete len:499 (-) Transcript_22792:173-1669(-)
MPEEQDGLEERQTLLQEDQQQRPTGRKGLYRMLTMATLALVSVVFCVGFLTTRQHHTLPQRKAALVKLQEQHMFVNMHRVVPSEEDRVPTQAWSQEEAFVETQLQALGNTLLTAVYENYSVSSSSQSTKKDADCSTCDPTPFYINPSCATVCKDPHGHAAKLYCWHCRHWAINLKSEAGPTPRLAQSILDLPILVHVVTLASNLLHANGQELHDMFDKHNPGFASLGKLEVADIAQRLGDIGVPLSQVNSSGGGGGMGFQIYCNSSLLVSLGGGGGQGFAQDANETSFGGGRGAGLQIYSNKSQIVPLISYGGGAGGGVKLSHNQSGTHLTSSAGSSPDAKNQTIPQAIIDELHSHMRECWQHGNFTVVGGGGLGGGARGTHGLSSSGSVAFRFQAFQNPCAASCLPGNFQSLNQPQQLQEHEKTKPANQTVPHAKSVDPFKNTCDTRKLANVTIACAEACDDKPYDTCMCPCFQEGFLYETECEWAKRIHCQPPPPQ